MNKIHPTVVIEGDVELGERNEILPYSVLLGPLKIGNDNLIGPHAVIGSPGQDTRDPRHDASQRRVVIGNNNIIREFTAVQKPCYTDITELKNEIYLMQSVHIPHDTLLEDKVVITPMVALAGIARLLEGANVAMGATVHQYSVIGQYSIVGMGAEVMKNVKPFSRLVPGKPTSVNVYAIKKFGFEEHLAEIEAYVLENRRPTSPVVASIVEHYEQLHEKSGRPQY